MRASRSCNEYDPELFQKVKESVTMQQAVEYCGLLIKNGHCLCPFHQDKNPSMKIYPDGKGYYCFACGAGGDQIQFVARYHDIKNYEAAKELASVFGVPIQVPVTYREKREAQLRQKKRSEAAAFKKWAVVRVRMYWILLCEAIHEHNEHFDEALQNITYIEYLLDNLEECPEEVYEDKKAVKRIGEIEGRIINWYIRIEIDGSISR